LAAVSAALQLGWVGVAPAEIAGNAVRIGVMDDMVGPASDATGKGSVLAAQLAVEDFAKSILGDVKVDVIQADHQNKPDIAAALARRWVETEHVNAFVGVTNSSAALAVNEALRNSKAVFMPSGAGTTELTGAKCSPNTIHWTYDTWSVGNATARAVVRAGNKSWFFITADYAFGHSLEIEAAKVVKAEGGQVLGAVRHPYATPDLSSFLLQAQESHAQVVGLANSVVDTINAVKGAQEFGLTANGQKLAALLMLITDVHSLGLEAAQGLYLTEAFYWDMNDGTREFSKKFAARMGGKHPTMLQGGVYSSVIHYMKAVKAANTTDGLTVAAKMKETPTEDAIFGKGKIRVDGRKIHDLYLFQVKAPSESKGPWDYYKLIQTIPAAEAFRPLSEGGCPLVKS
jgi:branched-chain amino acid transport system substrate-binding protein